MFGPSSNSTVSPTKRAAPTSLAIAAYWPAEISAGHTAGRPYCLLAWSEKIAGISLPARLQLTGSTALGSRFAGSQEEVPKSGRF